MFDSYVLTASVVKIRTFHHELPSALLLGYLTTFRARRAKQISKSSYLKATTARIEPPTSTATTTDNMLWNPVFMIDIITIAAFTTCFILTFVLVGICLIINADSPIYPLESQVAMHFAQLSSNIQSAAEAAVHGFFAALISIYEHAQHQETFSAYSTWTLFTGVGVTTLVAFGIAYYYTSGVKRGRDGWPVEQIQQKRKGASALPQIRAPVAFSAIEEVQEPGFNSSTPPPQPRCPRAPAASSASSIYPVLYPVLPTQEEDRTPEPGSSTATFHSAENTPWTSAPSSSAFAVTPASSTSSHTIRLSPDLAVRQINRKSPLQSSLGSQKAINMSLEERFERLRSHARAATVSHNEHSNSQNIMSWLHQVEEVVETSALSRPTSDLRKSSTVPLEDPFIDPQDQSPRTGFHNGHPPSSREHLSNSTLGHLPVTVHETYVKSIPQPNISQTNRERPSSFSPSSSRISRFIGSGDINSNFSQENPFQSGRYLKHAPVSPSNASLGPKTSTFLQGQPFARVDTAIESCPPTPRLLENTPLSGNRSPHRASTLSIEAFPYRQQANIRQSPASTVVVASHIKQNVTPLQSSYGRSQVELEEDQNESEEDSEYDDDIDPNTAPDDPDFTPSSSLRRYRPPLDLLHPSPSHRLRPRDACGRAVSAQTRDM